VASGLYAVYPAALNASQSLFLEPWLILCCLLGTVLLFDGDHLAGHRGGPGRPGSRRVFWAGVCFGFGAAVKIWAAVPALVAWLLCVSRGVRGDGSATAGGSGGVVPPRRQGLPFVGGFAVGLTVPCLPFLILAPNGFGRTVFVSELVQATHGRVGVNLRLADITGVSGLSSVGVDPKIRAGYAAAGVLVLLMVIAWLRAGHAGRRALALDRFALTCTLVVTAMLFLPSEWYVHYAAFAGPFLAVLVGLSAGRLAAAWRPAVRTPRLWAGVAAALLIAAMGAADGYLATMLKPAPDLSAASALIPPGACVLTDTVSATVVIGRFSAASPGCPAVVDAVGTPDRHHRRQGGHSRPCGLAGRHAGLAAGVRTGPVRLADRQQRLHRRADRLDPGAARLLQGPLQADRPARRRPRHGQRPTRRALYPQAVTSKPRCDGSVT
jgi:Glycosyltransferase family 87